MTAITAKTRSRGQAIKDTRGDKIFYFICYTIVTLLVLIVLYPLVYILSASFSSAAAITDGRMWLWPVDFTLIGYEYVLGYDAVWIGYRNTLFYTFVGTLINVAMTMTCAYGLSRRGMRGRRFFNLLFTFTMIFKGGMIPNYLLMKDLGMLNTVWSMLIPGAISVYNLTVARTFIENNIPNDLLEAAHIDGCSDIRFFFSMVLPLSKAILAVLLLMYASTHWNTYFNAFLYLNDRELYPLQIFLRQILVQNNMSADMLDPEALAQIQTLQQIMKYTVIVISTAPMLCLYPFVQKYFEQGMMIGSIKG
ncbi:MAG: carbohydrate ABC transporter permease [Clostridia bacterium]|nr:carbohydrate ABC transporter permease [Clostridia bacterium]